MDFGALLSDTWKSFIANIVQLILFFFIGVLLCFTVILIPTVMGGWARGFLKVVRDGEKPEFNELWDFSNYLQLALLCIVSGTIVMIGYMLLVIPGIIFSVWFLYAMFFVADKNMNFWEAMMASKDRAGQTGFFNHFVVLIILCIINAIGSFAGGLGTLVTGPFGFLLLTLVYADMIDSNSE